MFRLKVKISWKNYGLEFLELNRIVGVLKINANVKQEGRSDLENRFLNFWLMKSRTGEKILDWMSIIVFGEFCASFNGNKSCMVSKVLNLNK